MTAPVAWRGFSEEAVHELNARQDEPTWMRERRLDAWKIYEGLPMPTRQDEEWRRTDLRALKLDDIAPFAEGAAAVEKPAAASRAGRDDSRACWGCAMASASSILA